MDLSEFYVRQSYKLYTEMLYPKKKKILLKDLIIFNSVYVCTRGCRWPQKPEECYPLEEEAEFQADVCPLMRMLMSRSRSSERAVP